MRADTDLVAAVYDPPAPGFPHMAALFDPAGELIAVQPVDSIDAGEAALAHLVGQLAHDEPDAA